MDCCGGRSLSRPRVHAPTVDVGYGAVLRSARCSAAAWGRAARRRRADRRTASAALDVLRKSISVDVHTHGGTTGITSRAAQ